MVGRGTSNLEVRIDVNWYVIAKQKKLLLPMFHSPQLLVVENVFLLVIMFARNLLLNSFFPALLKNNAGKILINSETRYRTSKMEFCQNLFGSNKRRKCAPLVNMHLGNWSPHFEQLLPWLYFSVKCCLALERSAFYLPSDTSRFHLFNLF